MTTMSFRVCFPDGQLGGPYSPADIQGYFADGRIPPGSHVETADGWMPVESWLSGVGAAPAPPSTPALQPRKKLPIRSWPVALAVLVLPPFWFLVHLIALSWSGVGWIILIGIMSVVAAILLLVTPLRRLGPGDMFRQLTASPRYWAPVVGAAVLVFGAITFSGLRGQWQNQRIDSAIAAAKSVPCAIETLSPTDREEAGWLRGMSIEDMEKKCKEAKAAGGVLERHRKRTAAYLSACKKLEVGLDKPSALVRTDYAGLEPYDVDMGLLERIHKDELKVTDLNLSFDKLPCSNDLTRDGPANPFPGVRKRFLSAVRRSAGAWQNVTRVSEDTLTDLERDGLAADVAKAFERNTERNALRALGDPSLGATSLALPAKQCEIAKRVGAYPKATCERLERRHQQRAKEEARRSAARDEPAARARKAECARKTPACVRQCNSLQGEANDRCLMRCMPGCVEGLAAEYGY